MSKMDLYGSFHLIPACLSTSELEGVSRCSLLSQLRVSTDARYRALSGKERSLVAVALTSVFLPKTPKEISVSENLRAQTSQVHHPSPSAASTTA